MKKHGVTGNWENEARILVFCLKAVGTSINIFTLVSLNFLLYKIMFNLEYI